MISSNRGVPAGQDISAVLESIQTAQRDDAQRGGNALRDTEIDALAQAFWESTKQAARIAAEDAKLRAPDQAPEINRLLKVFVTSEPPDDDGAVDMKSLALTGLIASFQVLSCKSVHRSRFH